VAHCVRWESFIAMGTHGSIHAEKLSGSKNVHLQIARKFRMRGDLIALCVVTRWCLYSYTGGTSKTKILVAKKMKYFLKYRSN
jgi:hypothetical protein